MLCPVRWWSAGGQLLAMASAQPLSKADHEELLDDDGFPDWDYMPGEDGQPFEFKASDWGRIKGRLVALDYSTPAHDTPEQRGRAQQVSFDYLVSAPKKRRRHCKT
jgi:hypothetical protein